METIDQIDARLRIETLEGEVEHLHRKIDALLAELARQRPLADQVEAILAAITLDETKGGGSLSRETLRVAGTLRQAFLRAAKK